MGKINKLLCDKVIFFRQNKMCTQELRYNNIMEIKNVSDIYNFV